METASIVGVTNSISRFILLMSCLTSKSMPSRKEFESMASMLKHMKPILDEIGDGKIPSDEKLQKMFEGLDMSVNAAREFVERWSPKMSRILTVLQSEQLLAKIRSFSLDICHILCGLVQTSLSSSSLASVQHCVQELQSRQSERISKQIKQGINNKNDKLNSWSEHLEDIVDLLGLLSSQELLKESIAVERESVKLHAKKCNEKMDQINLAIDLLALIRDYILRNGCLGTMNGVPIPSHFRCPLSLDFMLDPVIVASGQTFERSSIQKWIEHGLRLCPKTRQYLSHIKFIPNYTVKALISNWMEEKNLKLPTNFSSSDIHPKASLSENLSSQDVIRTDSFRCSVHSSDTMSRYSSLEAGDAGVNLKISELSVSGEVSSNKCQSIEVNCSDQSPEHLYTHSRTQSVSSAVSCSDYVPSAATEMSTTSDWHRALGSVLGETVSESGTPLAINSLSRRGSQSAKTSAEIWSNNCMRVSSLPVLDSGYDETITLAQVNNLVEDLKSPSKELQTAAVAQIRCLAKHNMENRVIIGKSGAIDLLISLLQSDFKTTQEQTVTALLNLSLHAENKKKIAEAGVSEPLIHILESGTNEAKENSAALLFSLSVLGEYKVKIGCSGAVKALVDLLAQGTVRGKKDAATALFNLSICPENRARIVQSGAVKYLVQLLDPSEGMVDKSIALLANLCTVSEGRSAIAREGGIPLIVEIVDMGSRRGKENAASILLELCLNNAKFCSMVLQEGAIPALVALSQSGTLRAKEKAQQLLGHFRSQREGAKGKRRN